MWNYSDYRLVTKQRDFHRLSRQLNFKRCEIVTPESCVIELQKTNVVLSKPRYVGVAVLGISKYLMGDFHYNYIMKNFDPKQTGRNVKLLMTDTDSFVYDLAFPPQVVYPMLRRQIAPYMDFSNYNQSMRYHHYYDPSRKCVPGYFKDENNGNFILEFAGIFLPLKLDHQIIFFYLLIFSGLCSKCYSFSFEENSGQKSKKALKGISTSYANKHVNHQQYIDVIFDNQPPSERVAVYPQIRSKKQALYTVKTQKILPYPFNTKKYFSDMLTCHSFGHYSISSS